MTELRRSQRPWLLIHLVLLAAAAAVLTWANRGQWFFGDEWEFLVNRGFAGARLSLWYPHNEHWSTLPILVYTLLRNTVGLGSYWPYIAVLIAVHLVLTHLLWRVMLRSGVLPAVATVAAAVFSVLGAGAENLLWAFQIGFVGSVALGWAGALVAAAPDRRPARRDIWAVLLLVGSLMCSGIGIPMVVIAVVAAWTSSRALWRPLVVGGVPTVVFLIWYLTVGRVPLKPGTGMSGLREVLALIRDGLGTMAERALGTPRLVTLALLVVLAAWCLWAAVGVVRGAERLSVRGLALAGVPGILAFCLMITFGRGALGPGRYVYVVVAMAMPAAAVAVSALCRRRWAQAVVVVAFVAVGVHNVAILRSSVQHEASREGRIREVVEAAGVLVTNGTAVIGHQPDPVYNPDLTVAAMRTFIERNGLPTRTTERGDLGARLYLQVVAIPPGSGPPSSPALVTGSDGVVETDALPSCLVPDGAANSGKVVLDIDGHVRSIWLLGDAASYELFLGDGPSAPPARYVGVPDGQVTEVLFNLPPGTPDLTVRARSSTSLVCLAAP